MKRSCLIFSVLLCFLVVGCGTTHLVKAYRSSVYMDNPCIVGELKLGWHDRWQALWTGRVRLMQRPIFVPPNYDQPSWASRTNATQPFGMVFGNKLTWDEGRYGWADIDLSHWADSVDSKTNQK